MSHNQRTRAWSGYWATGAGHSCAESFALTGDGAIASFWREAFSRLPDRACVVDLGTGNGGLLQVAWELRRPDQEWTLVGIDLAQPGPGWLVPALHGQWVRLHGGTPMEELPLADASADLLVSQFGVEYADRERVGQECLRVLAPGGGLAFVLHHAASAVTAAARDESRAQGELLGADGLLQATSALLPHLAAVRAGQAPRRDAEQARLTFNAAMRRARELAQSLAVPDLLVDAINGLQQMLATTSLHAAAEQQRQLAVYADDLAHARLRTDEQVACALDDAGLEAFLAPFREAGLALAPAPIHESVHLVGWAVSGRRSG